MEPLDANNEPMAGAMRRALAKDRAPTGWSAAVLGALPRAEPLAAPDQVEQQVEQQAERQAEQQAERRLTAPGAETAVNYAPGFGHGFFTLENRVVQVGTMSADDLVTVLNSTSQSYMTKVQEAITEFYAGGNMPVNQKAYAQAIGNELKRRMERHRTPVIAQVRTQDEIKRGFKELVRAEVRVYLDSDQVAPMVRRGLMFAKFVTGALSSYGRVAALELDIEARLTDRIVSTTGLAAGGEDRDDARQQQLAIAKIYGGTTPHDAQLPPGPATTIDLNSTNAQQTASELVRSHAPVFRVYLQPAEDGDFRKWAQLVFMPGLFMAMTDAWESVRVMLEAASLRGGGPGWKGLVEYRWGAVAIETMLNHPRLIHAFARLAARYHTADADMRGSMVGTNQHSLDIRRSVLEEGNRMRATLHSLGILVGSARDDKAVLRSRASGRGNAGVTLRQMRTLGVQALDDLANG